MRKTVLFCLIGILFFAFYINPQPSSAVTAEELERQIKALQQQIELLKKQQMVGQTSVESSSAVEMRPEIMPIPPRPTVSSSVFTRDLYFGMRNNSDVSNLQEFLTDQGYYAGPVSGNYFLLTVQAVKKFQSANGINPTGYFGPKSRAVANEIIAKMINVICPQEEGCDGRILPPEKLTITTDSELRGFIGEYFQARFYVSGGSGRYRIETDGNVPGLSWTQSSRCVPPAIGDPSSGTICVEDFSQSSIMLYGRPEKSGVYDVVIFARDLREVPECEECLTVTPVNYSYGKERFTVVISDKVVVGRYPVISGVKGPTTLKVGEEGLWTINAYDPANGSLSYSVTWGDEVYYSREGAVAAPPALSPVVQTGTFSHVYSNPGTYTPVFRVVNDKGLEAKTSLSVSVTGGTSQTIEIKTGSSLVGIVGKPFEASFSAYGGSPPYNWYISAGSLPPGLNLEKMPLPLSPCYIDPASGKTYCPPAPVPTNVLLGGIPTQGGTYKFDVAAKDRYGNFGSRTFVSEIAVIYEQTAEPSIKIMSTPPDSYGKVTLKKGEKLVITGYPRNLYGTMLQDYKRAFFFDPIFDHSCGNTEWEMTCTANNLGVSKLYIEIYKDGKTYRSNIIEVTVTDGTVVTTYQGLSLSFVSGNKNAYAAGEKMALVMNAVEGYDGSAGMPNEGYNVQVYIQGTKDGYNLQGVNAVYNEHLGLWEAGFTAPADTSKTYWLRAYFYCSTDSVCLQRYPEKTSQVEVSFYFSIFGSQKSSVTVVSPNGGESYQIGQTLQMPIKWTADCGFKSFSIALVKGNNVTQVINNSIPAGICSLGDLGVPYYTTWPIPSTMQTGSDYKLLIVGSTGDGSSISDDSDSFFNILSQGINYDACRLDQLNGSNITRDAIEDKATCLAKICDIYGPANLEKGIESKCVFLGQEIKRYMKIAAALSVDLKVNGSDYPESVPYDSLVTASWTSTGTVNCSVSGPSDPLPVVGGGIWTDFGTLPLSGSKTMYARHNSLGYDTPLELTVACHDGVNQVKDTVYLPVYKQTSAAVTVISPNGGENWKAGQTYPIKWSGLNFPAGGAVTIAAEFLLNSVNTYLFSEIENSGSVDWTVPLNMTAGSYKMRIFCGIKGTDRYCSSDGTKSSGTEDYSDAAFSIVSESGAQPMISMLSPNGGETWQAGSAGSLIISWNASCSFTSSSFDVRLYKGQYVVQTTNTPRVLCPSTQTVMQYSVAWPASSSWFAGSDYRIGVATNDWSASDQSDGYFNVVSSTAVCSPAVSCETPPSGCWYDGGTSCSCGKIVCTGEGGGSVSESGGGGAVAPAESTFASALAGIKSLLDELQDIIYGLIR